MEQRDRGTGQRLTATATVTACPRRRHGASERASKACEEAPEQQHQSRTTSSSSSNSTRTAPPPAVEMEMEKGHGTALASLPPPYARYTTLRYKPTLHCRHSVRPCIKSVHAPCVHLAVQGSPPSTLASTRTMTLRRWGPEHEACTGQVPSNRTRTLEAAVSGGASSSLAARGDKRVTERQSLNCLPPRAGRWREGRACTL